MPMPIFALWLRPAESASEEISVGCGVDVDDAVDGVVAAAKGVVVAADEVLVAMFHPFTCIPATVVEELKVVVSKTHSAS